MKKILITLLFLMICVPVNAASSIESEINEIGSYTNNEGVIITKENYEKMKDYMTDAEIETLSSRMYQQIDSSKRIVAMESAVIETIYLNVGNKKIFLEQNVLTQEEYNEKTLISPYVLAIHDTEYKHIKLMATDNGANYTFNIENSWKKIPDYKSFDVIALRWEGSVVRTTESESGIQDYKSFPQQVNPPYINYSSNSSNFKKASNGIGLSQNLVDGEYYYVNTMSIKATCSGNVTLYGTYQHAQGDLTLEQSQSYTFSSSGLGSVLNYSNSTIRNTYDNTAGLKVSFTC